MATRGKNELGPTGTTVAANIRRIRTGKKLTYAEISRRLEELGHPIAPLGLRRIEVGERRVDVDDLFALARVLGTEVATLYTPNVEDGDEIVDVTGFGKMKARSVYLMASEPVADSFDANAYAFVAPRFIVKELQPLLAERILLRKSVDVESQLDLLREQSNTAKISADRSDSNGEG